MLILIFFKSTEEEIRQYEDEMNARYFREREARILVLREEQEARDLELLQVT